MRTLFEAIQDNDKTVVDKTSLSAQQEDVREWMKYATSGKCVEDIGKGWYFDDQGYIHIVGYCPYLTIDKELYNNDRISYVKIVELEPTSLCTCLVKDADAAEKVLPVQVGNSHYKWFLLKYDVKGNLEPRHFPMFTHGNISISCTGHLNLCIMPDCSGEITIYHNKASRVTYPSGFPVSTGKIIIHR